MGSAPKFAFGNISKPIKNFFKNRLKSHDLSFDIKQKGLAPKIKGQTGAKV